MASPKLWFKKRTTRGGGRVVRGKTSLTRPNIVRELYKNQRVYSHFVLKFLLFALAGMIWLRLGAPILGIESIPVGGLIGLILICFEPFRIGRGIELVILVLAALASYVFSIGLVL